MYVFHPADSANIPAHDACLTPCTELVYVTLTDNQSIYMYLFQGSFSGVAGVHWSLWFGWRVGLELVDQVHHLTVQFPLLLLKLVRHDWGICFRRRGLQLSNSICQPFL